MQTNIWYCTYVFLMRICIKLLRLWPKQTCNLTWLSVLIETWVYCSVVDFWEYNKEILELDSINLRNYKTSLVYRQWSQWQRFKRLRTTDKYWLLKTVLDMWKTTLMRRERRFIMRVMRMLISKLICATFWS